jgi:hypothetical protein
MTKGGTLAIVGLGLAALFALFAGSAKAEEQPAGPPAPPPEPPPEPLPDMVPHPGPPAGPPPSAPPSPAPPASHKPVRPSELAQITGYRTLRKSELTPELVSTANAMLRLGDPPGKMYPFDYQGRKLVGVVTDMGNGKRGVVLMERPV